MNAALTVGVSGLGLGLALASAPGPVQAVLLSESVRGGPGSGLRAMAGANGTFALLLTALALGISLAVPGGTALRVLKAAGGCYLAWLAVDGFRSTRVPLDRQQGGTVPALVRGMLAVLLNPGGWLFLATAASSLLALATRQAGREGAVLTAVALVAGLAVGDGSLVLLGGYALRRSHRYALWVRRFLSCVLAAFGLALVASGLVS